ncbi:MAG TPA: nucleoside deaminase [Tepidisphaeraceae bacterium]|jgi:tRNA(Arg) A34 adenosine deaminase TadA
MDECVDLARTAMRLGEVPIASVVARGGEVIGWGWNEFRAKRDLTMHAEIAAMRDAAGRYPLDEPDLILVTTLEPCVMCTGAAYLCGVSTIVYALPAPADGGMGRVAPPSSPEANRPAVVGPMRQDEIRGMFKQWMARHGDAGPQGKFVAQLLALTEA